MTQEEKQLLIKDLCGRLPYGVKCNAFLKQIDGSLKSVFGTFKGYNGWATVGNNLVDIETVKPYLRPMSSMTYEDMQLVREKFFDGSDHYDIDATGEIFADTYQPYTSIYTLSFARLSGYIGWLDKNKFDYRGLIPMGLALEAPKDMYKTE